MISEHDCRHVKIQLRLHGALFWLLNLFLVLAIGLGASATRADTVTGVGRADKLIGITGAGYRPWQVAITPDGQYAYVASEGGTVSVIATAKNTVHPPNTVVGDPIKVGFNLGGVAITPDGQYVYVIDGGSTSHGPVRGKVNVIATAKNTTYPPNTVVGSPIQVGIDAWAVAITPDGQYAYVTNGDGTVSVIATAKNAAHPPNTIVGSPIKVGRPLYPLYDIAISPDGQYAYVVDGYAVRVIATAENTTYPPDTVVGSPIAVGKGAFRAFLI